MLYTRNGAKTKQSLEQPGRVGGKDARFEISVSMFVLSQDHAGQYVEEGGRNERKPENRAKMTKKLRKNRKNIFSI
jgi:hypothetical protein